MNEELWKDIQGFVGIYQISNFGRIKSLSRVTPHGHYRKERFLARTIDKNGYCVVKFRDKRNNIECQKFVHRLVAQAFIHNPNSKPQINHKDTIKTNNKAQNLEWCSILENMQHARKEKLIIYEGENNPNAKLTHSQVEDIKTRLYTKHGFYANLAREFNINSSNIHKIRNGKLWKTK